MNKFNKKLYYKFFDLFQISQFKQDKLVSDKAKMMMTLIKNNADKQLDCITQEIALSIGFTRDNYVLLKEFQETHDITFISNYVSSIPEWIRNIVLPGFFSDINLGEIFSTLEINTSEQLYEYFGNEEFIKENGKEVSQLYQHLVLKSRWEDFPLMYASSHEENENIVTHQQNPPIVGNFHNHTTYSDGELPLEDLVDLALNNGREYIGISEHSKSCYGGISEDELMAQCDVIDAINIQQKIRVLKSIECEILSNGQLDLANEYLKLLDYVIIGIHTHSIMTKPEMERRMIKAIENPYSKILAHPSARIYKKKPPILVDMYKIIDACVQNGVTLEINGDPARLDLDPKYINYALDQGAFFTVDSDTHSVNGFKNINNAIRIVHELHLPIDRCLNFLKYEQIVELLKSGY